MNKISIRQMVVILGMAMTLAAMSALGSPTNEWIATSAGNASSGANWSLSHAPLATEQVLLGSNSVQNMTWDVVNAVAAWFQTADYTGTVTIDARYDGTLPGLFITGDCQVLGGKWTHPANGGAEVYRLRASVGGNFTLSATASLNADQKGYGPGQGPGAGSAGNNNGYPAASYGGMGGEAFNPTYGSYTAPTNLGSSAYTIGGGAVWLTVGGTATLNGTITARPDSSLAQGSGGSIFVQAGSLAGSGTMDVSCPYNGWIQRGGGGGRIAVVLTSGPSFGSVMMNAHGGQSQDSVSGAAGTIYLQTSSQTEGTGTLLIDNAGIATVAQTLVTPAQSNLNTFSALIITNKAVLGLNTNTALNLGSASLFTYGPSQSFIATRQTVGMQLPPTWQLQNCTLQIYTNLEVPGSLTITNASLEMFSSGETNIHIGADLVIKSGGVLSHGVNGSTEAYRVALWVDGNLTIEASGAIDVTGKGYGQAQGPGHGTGDAYGTGASYGGMGGFAISPTYGSITSPTNLGSGGLRYGGGAVLLHVNGTTSLAGSILAKGGSSEGYAGDSGGSIFLTIRDLAGNGAIDASANADCLNSNGGGGGRIAVILTGSSSFGSVAMKAYGGKSGAAAGTVYLQTSTQASETGTLIIDNGGLSGVAQTLITPAQSNLNTFSSIIITNKGVLGLNSNTLLNLGSPVNLAVYGPAQSLIVSPQTAGLQLVGDWTLSGYALQLYTNLDMSGNLVVTNGTLEMIAGWQTNVHVGGNVTVANGGLISHGGNGAVEQNRLNIQVDGDLMVAAGGLVDVTGKGYGNSQGPGRGNGQNHNRHAAASHGGLGGYPESDPLAEYADPGFYVPYWTTYGSITSPTNLGSGGMVSGGGAISLKVSGATSLQGSLIAKGMDTWASGAAGGSILLITSTLTGNGAIDASAGASGQCGGGGGRIAVKLTLGTSVDTVSMRAFGGSSYKGAAGTIYCETADAGVGRGTLTIFGDATPYRTDTITAIPSATNAPMVERLSLKYVTLVATNYANVSILTNITMGNLFLRDDSSKLRLNGNTLTLKAVYHADWGTTNRVVYAGGEIIWDPGAGTVFTIR